MKMQIEMLANDLAAGKKPDASLMKDIRKTMGNYAINRYIDLIGHAGTDDDTGSFSSYA